MCNTYLLGWTEQQGGELSKVISRSSSSIICNNTHLPYDTTHHPGQAHSQQPHKLQVVTVGRTDDKGMGNSLGQNQNRSQELTV